MMDAMKCSSHRQPTDVCLCYLGDEAKGESPPPDDLSRLPLVQSAVRGKGCQGRHTAATTARKQSSVMTDSCVQRHLSGEGTLEGMGSRGIQEA